MNLFDMFMARSSHLDEPLKTGSIHVHWDSSSPRSQAAQPAAAEDGQDHMHVRLGIVSSQDVSAASDVHPDTSIRSFGSLSASFESEHFTLR